MSDVALSCAHGGGGALYYVSREEILCAGGVSSADPGIFPLSVSAGRDTSLFLKRRKAMLPLPLPPNPLNPFGIVSSTIAVTATVAGLGVGLTLGAAMLATCSMMSRRR
jgi:hypothetical protein